MMSMRDGKQIREAAFSKDGIYAENDAILLREIRPSDREDYIGIYRVKGIWQKLFAVPGVNPGEGLWESFVDPETLNTVIIRKSDGAFCGFCGLQQFETLEAPELSIELVPNCQHQGIGTMALPLLMKRFAEITGVREFISEVQFENAASQGLMRKLGGIPDGAVPIPGISEEILKEVENSDAPLMEGAEALAEEFGIAPRQLLSHVMVFRFTIDA